MRTHRCEGSLKNEISIRYAKMFQNIDYQDDYYAWRLFNVGYNSDYGSIRLYHVSKIEYCPFCGKKLEI